MTGEATVLRTQRLTLRPIRAAEDADALHEMLSDPEVMRYWSTLPHETMRQTLDWIEENRLACAAGTAIELGVLREGRLIGRVTFWNGNEVGYLFGRSAWGQGFALEAMTALIDHGFAIRDWDCAVAEIDPLNTASLKLLERLGFHRSGLRERTFCIGGVWSDSLDLTLRRSDWLARLRP